MAGERLKYRMEVQWSPDDDCYVATMPELLGCTAHGGTWAEAAREAEVARDLWLETAEEMGRKLPVADARRRP